MRNNLFIILLASILWSSCQHTPSTENTKTESDSVIEVTSQPVVTTEKPISTSTPDLNERSDSPIDPLPPKKEAVVTNSTPPQAATAPQPSPDRTNVSPAKVVATKNTTSKSTPKIETNQNSPATSPAIGANEPSGTPRDEVEKSEEIKQATIASPPISSDETKPQNPPNFSHQTWDDLLRSYVSATGKVNYTGLKANKSKLEGYLNDLKNNPPQNDWSRIKTMAYWINAYNAFTVKLILDNYPVSSINKLEGGKPWDKKWIKIGNNTYSLNNIENDILRPKYKDPRIHFAVNCAAKSCPPLLNRAWTEDNLNSNFEKQAKEFINNSNYNKITASKVQVSKIFEWYAADFGNLTDYLNKYASTKINSNAKVEYLEYNWDLNE